MKTLALAIMLLSWPIIAPGQVKLDKNILVNPQTHYIDVYVPPKSLKEWDNKMKWTIVALDSSGNVQKVEIHEFKPDADKTMFVIVPDDTSANSPIAKATQLIIKFDKDVAIVGIPKPGDQSSSGSSVAPASSKQNSDLYISGTYSPAVNSPPQYQIDGFVALMKDWDAHNYNYGQYGVIGSVTTDKRRQVDPDSYRIFGAYQNALVTFAPDSNTFDTNAAAKKSHNPLQGILFTWLVGGAEFDRKADNVNFITAPSLDFPIRLFPNTIRATTQPMAILTVTLGIEAGHNFHNAVTPDSGRGIFRGVIGGNLLYRFNPKLPGFKGMELTSAYTLRLPAVDEIFTSTTTVNGQSVDVPFLSSKARHYIKQELDFKLSDFFSLALKHEYGAIPPAFRMVDHKASVGITFSLRQTRGGVPTAIRNK